MKSVSLKVHEFQEIKMWRYLHSLTDYEIFYFVWDSLNHKFNPEVIYGECHEIYK